MNKVLVVEDDQGIRQIIKHNLVRESFTVFEAEDGVVVLGGHHAGWSCGGDRV